MLVIIGLLLGGVLKGQELITGARVRNLISQQDGIKAAFFGFQDRFRALPGDYASASTNINSMSARTATVMAGSRTTPLHPPSYDEEILAWNHLTAAGFLNGSFTVTSGDTAADRHEQPQEPVQCLPAGYLRRQYTEPERHRSQSIT